METVKRISKKMGKLVLVYFVAMTVFWIMFSIFTYMHNEGVRSSNEQAEGPPSWKRKYVEYPALTSFYVWPLEVIDNMRITR